MNFMEPQCLLFHYFQLTPILLLPEDKQERVFLILIAGHIAFLDKRTKSPQKQIIGFEVIAVHQACACHTLLLNHNYTLMVLATESHLNHEESAWKASRLMNRNGNSWSVCVSCDSEIDWSCMHNNGSSNEIPVLKRKQTQI